MKSLLHAALAALTLAAQASPALAVQTAAPKFTLVPLSPSHAAVVSHKPGCDAEAGINGTPYFEMPTIAQEMDISGTSSVKIDLAATGDLRAASLFQSSGNRWLDEAALRSARMTRYVSETIDCQHVAGSYLLEVEF
jgi:TonB family protein